MLINVELSELHGRTKQAVFFMDDVIFFWPTLHYAEKGPESKNDQADATSVQNNAGVRCKSVNFAANSSHFWTKMNKCNVGLFKMFCISVSICLVWKKKTTWKFDKSTVR